MVKRCHEAGVHGDHRGVGVLGEHQVALANRAKLVRAGDLGVPPEVDLALVEAADKDKVPMAFSVGDCAWLRTADRALWSLSGEGGALTRDGEREKLFRTTPGARVTIGCTVRGVAASIPAGLDSVAADAASAAGVPYRWTDSCRQFVRMNGQRYELPDAPTAQGTALSTEILGWGCNSGVERPGGKPMIAALYAWTRSPFTWAAAVLISTAAGAVVADLPAARRGGGVAVGGHHGEGRRLLRHRDRGEGRRTLGTPARIPRRCAAPHRASGREPRSRGVCAVVAEREQPRLVEGGGAVSCSRSTATNGGPGQSLSFPGMISSIFRVSSSWAAGSKP
ncbi:hypothetical protein [Mycolicibacterium mageritense]|uniref:Uncharacterized protein n=1 Tax=Mycolicibacterium mageritense TaxID=53462 RepID=A0AAI8TRB7_MYCME|nr:hypothetical protein [Mycolicibacterium mageritense]MCC9182140.1 hypothetical protein [Mycolicibacterium mageritense]TXI61841.1 MAG: hypothetical protein E6Q55_14655 [Mycolicibacterium mageritense]CDO23495.1 hypothetical protein BN978_03982 [Mycolicibacterium mageritense DSM 44476 = CIP 104973]BBX31958.1 hypothetical protein MMAGJ_12400 [Mycolicibacterium mageritense]BDY27110.1 hypothetical protein hbim_01027 [Mycolicibacterium mageritense]